MSHPEGLPRLFLDRSLGPIQVPRFLRAAGLWLVTLSEHYGTPRDQGIPDAEWLELVGSNGWVAFTKDKRIGRLRDQREAIVSNRVRCFYLANQNVAAEEMGNRFLRNLPRIVEACAYPGPFLYAVHKPGSRRCRSTAALTDREVRRVLLILRPVPELDGLGG